MFTVRCIFTDTPASRDIYWRWLVQVGPNLRLPDAFYWSVGHSIFTILRTFFCVISSYDASIFNGAELSSHDVIVVTFNYRLGVFGE